MHISDFVGGLAHPLAGADHILAMVAIGLWGALAGGRALWAWPASFVAMVVVGFAAAIFGLQAPLQREWISLRTRVDFRSRRLRFTLADSAPDSSSPARQESRCCA